MKIIRSCLYPPLNAELVSESSFRDGCLGKSPSANYESFSLDTYRSLARGMQESADLTRTTCDQTRSSLEQAPTFAWTTALHTKHGMLFTTAVPDSYYQTPVPGKAEPPLLKTTMPLSREM